jgi:hypothetical protein
VAGGEVSGGTGGPHTMPRRGLALDVPPCGVVVWCVPLRCPRCLSAPNLTKKFKKNFLEFFDKLYFRGFFKN